MNTQTARRNWRITLAVALLLSVVTFTGLVTPIGEFQPELLGLPYTLWTGILVTAGLVLCTWAATKYYPPDEAASEPESTE